MADKMITTRCTEQERERWTRAAKAAGKSLAQIIREHLNKMADEHEAAGRG